MQTKYIIYTIEINGLFYVGSCSALYFSKKTKSGKKDGFPVRCSEHRRLLKHNKHYSKKLQEKYNLNLQQPVFSQVRYFEADTIYDRQREEEKEIRRLERKGKEIANSNRYDRKGIGIKRYRSKKQELS
jgi:hypothetical protein